jgi:hypothetical protein
MKVIILFAPLFAFLILLTKCNQEIVTDDVYGRFGYAKDPKTGLCFAHGFRSLAHVPCEALGDRKLKILRTEESE